MEWLLWVRFPSMVFEVRSSSVSQNQTKNKIETFMISVGFQRADGKRKSNKAYGISKCDAYSLFSIGIGSEQTFCIKKIPPGKNPDL